MSIYKEMMDAQTLLFKGKDFCKAYNLKYLNEHYNVIVPQLQSVEEIYYKFNRSRNSWINYKDSLLDELNQNLSYAERIIYGLKHHKVNLNDIPETEYIDQSGFMYLVGARDGLDANASVRGLLNLYLNNVQMGHWEMDEYDHKKLVDGYGYSSEYDCKYLVVKFKADITNAIIIFNGLFEKYEVYNTSTIIYYEKDGLSFPKKIKYII